MANEEQKQAIIDAMPANNDFGAQKSYLRGLGSRQMRTLLEGFQFELGLPVRALQQLSQKGKTNLRKHKVNAEGLAALPVAVHRGAFFAAYESLIDDDVAANRDRAGVNLSPAALALNVHTLNDAVSVVQDGLPSNVNRISVNLEPAGMLTPKFASRLDRAFLGDHDGRIARRLDIEITERNADLLQDGKRLTTYQAIVARMHEIGLGVIVDDLIIDPKNPDDIDLRLSPAVGITGIKLDFSKPYLKSTHKPDGTKYTPAERDALPFDMQLVQRHLTALKDFYGDRPIPTIIPECIGGKENLEQILALIESNPEINFGSAQGYAFARANRDLNALASQELVKPELQAGYVAPAPEVAPEITNAADASSRAGGDRQPGRFRLLAGLGTAAAAAVALVGFLGDQLSGPRPTDPVDDGDSAAAEEVADAEVVDVQRGLSVADVVNDDFNDGFMTIGGTRVEFVGEDRGLGIGNGDQLHGEVLEVAQGYAAALNERPLDETAAEADARLREAQRASDLEMVERAIRTGQPIVLNSGRGPGPGSGGIR